MVGRLSLVGLVGLGAVLLIQDPRAARAETTTLIEARKAIAEVRYHDAQPLLVAALEQGGNLPDEVIEIYRLSASAATVLGQPEVAESYYQRWLALVPDAVLPDSVAPKLRDPFKAAQTAMATRGRLSVTARRRTTAGADWIDVVVEADPLAMVTSVAIDSGSGGPLVPTPVPLDHTVHLEHPAGPVVAVVVLDEFNNHLLELPMIEPRPLRPGPTEPTRRRQIAWYRNPIAWAIPAVAFAGVGVGFGIAARRAQGDVEDILAHRDQHFIGELEAATHRRDRDALVANVGFVAAGAFAITGVVMLITRPRGTVTVVPTRTAGGVVVVMSRSW